MRIGDARTRATRAATAAAVLLGLSACDGAPPADAAGADPPFVEQARQIGLDFVHFNGMSGEYYFSETV